MRTNGLFSVRQLTKRPIRLTIREHEPVAINPTSIGGRIQGLDRVNIFPIESFCEWSRAHHFAEQDMNQRRKTQWCSRVTGIRLEAHIDLPQTIPLV